jgi:hypothetical protein
MTGAEAVLRTAAAAGVEVCFANPGTTEMALVSALDEVPIRAVLGLFEGVCSGAADGYARMRGRPALTLLHLGPGFANAIANLHNARRARSPVVNLDQAIRRPGTAPPTRRSPRTSPRSRGQSRAGCGNRGAPPPSRRTRRKQSRLRRERRAASQP